MSSEIRELAAFPAKLGAFVALLVAGSGVATELASVGEPPVAGGAPSRLPAGLYDLAAFENGGYAVIRYPGRLAAADSAAEPPRAVPPPRRQLPSALAGPLSDGTLLVGYHDGAVLSWARGRQAPWRLVGRHDGTTPVLSVSPDGRLAAAVSDPPGRVGGASPVTVWDLADGSASRFLIPGRVDRLGFCSDSERIVAFVGDGTLSVRQAPGGSLLRTIRCGAAAEAGGACSPAGPVAAWCGKPAADAATRVRLWDVSSGEPLWEAPVACGSVSPEASHPPRLAFSDDGALLACGISDAVTLFDASTGRALAEADAGPLPVTALRFAADGRAVVTAGHDGTIRWWRLPDLAECRSELFWVD